MKLVCIFVMLTINFVQFAKNIYVPKVDESLLNKVDCKPSIVGTPYFNIMKKIYLSGKIGKGKHMLVDDDDYQNLIKRKWHGFFRHGTYYAHTHLCTINDKSIGIGAHRMIMGCTAGDGVIIDHKDGNGLNNQKSNLRFATRSENARNKQNRLGASKFLGVCVNKAKYKDKIYFKWAAMIDNGKKRLTLGRFPFNKEGEMQAALAYNQAAIKYFGEFANLNIIPNYITLPIRKVKTSIYRGVHKDTRGKFVAQIKPKHIGTINIGSYDNEKDAALAYNKKAIELLGDKAIINQIID